MRKIKILIVEDNLENLKVIGRFIDLLGHDCDRATNGKEAISTFQNCNYDLILMDCEMPVMNGFETSEHLRLMEILNDRKTTPIIALTAHSLPEDKLECEKAGMNDYLLKPVTIKDIENMINKWCNQDEGEGGGI